MPLISTDSWVQKDAVQLQEPFPLPVVANPLLAFPVVILDALTLEMLLRIT
jgi:hypothetical protein